MALSPWGLHVVLVAPAGISTPAVERLRQDGEAAVARFSPAGRRRDESAFRAFLTTAVAREPQGSPPEVVARAVLTARTARRPRTRYPVGAEATAFTWLPRRLPTRWLDRVRFTRCGLPRTFGSRADSDPAGHP